MPVIRLQFCTSIWYLFWTRYPENIIWILCYPEQESGSGYMFEQLSHFLLVSMIPQKMNWIDSLLRSALFTLFWSKAIFTLNRHSKDNTFSTSWKGWSHNSCTDDRNDLCKIANGYSENALYQHCKWITTHQSIDIAGFHWFNTSEDKRAQPIQELNFTYAGSTVEMRTTVD